MARRKLPDDQKAKRINISVDKDVYSYAQEIGKYESISAICAEAITKHYRKYYKGVSKTDTAIPGQVHIDSYY